MEKGISAVLFVLAILVGASIGATGMYALAPIKEVEVVKEVPVEKIVEVVKEVPTTETKTVEVPNAELYLQEAIEDIFDELGDKSSFLTCNGHEFDEDEVTVSKVNEWSYTQFNDDEYEVAVELKLEYDDDSDERDCKQTRGYTVFYEDGEKPVVNK